LCEHVLTIDYIESQETRWCIYVQIVIMPPIPRTA